MGGNVNFNVKVNLDSILRLGAAAGIANCLSSLPEVKNSIFTTPKDTVNTNGYSGMAHYEDVTDGYKYEGNIPYEGSVSYEGKMSSPVTHTDYENGQIVGETQYKTDIEVHGEAEYSNTAEKSSKDEK